MLAKIRALGFPKMLGIEIARNGARLEIDAVLFIPAREPAPRLQDFMSQQRRGRVEDYEVQTATCDHFEIGAQPVEFAWLRDSAEKNGDVKITGGAGFTSGDRSEYIGETYVCALPQQPAHRFDPFHSPSIAVEERHGSAGALLGDWGVGGHVGAPYDNRTNSPTIAP